MTIQETIDQALKKEQDERGKKTRSGLWSPSSFGRCYRMQYWNRLNEPQTNPVDSRTLRIFRAGQLFHDFVQQFFPEAQTEVKVNAEDVFGYADIVLSDEVVDIKSVHSYQFHYTSQSTFDITKEKYTNILQVLSYAYFLGKPKGRLVFVSKDDLCIEEHVFFVDKWRSEIEMELTCLRKLWDSKELPPPHPRAYGGEETYNECKKYCCYKDLCVSKGHFIPEIKKTRKTKKGV